MSEKIITVENRELTKNKIIQVLEQLIINEKNCTEEKKQLAVNFSSSEDDFNLLEEIELLTTDIRGYACQIKAQDSINSEEIALSKLQKMRFFNLPNIGEFYFNNQLNFPQVKNYLQMLDYLRLLIIEYLTL